MGPRHHTAATDLIDDANDNGFRSSTYWALARGLAADISDAAWSDLDRPIPTPGLDQLLRGVADAVHECHTAVDDAYSLEGSEPPSSDTLLAIEMALIRSAQAAQQTAVLARRIAQLGLGVCEALDPVAHATDRLRQACTAVLFMFPLEPSNIIDDGVAMASRNIDEFAIEVSGLIGRMLLERDARVHIYVDSPFDGRQHLLVSVDDEAIRVDTAPVNDPDFGHTWCLHIAARVVAECLVESVIDHLGHDGQTLTGVRVSLI